MRLGLTGMFIAAVIFAATFNINTVSAQTSTSDGAMEIEEVTVTARRRQELVSREYQDERDQRVIFLLDCSRRMRTKDGDLSHFDHSLNAMILLSHVALRGGDVHGAVNAWERGLVAAGGEHQGLQHLLALARAGKLSPEMAAQHAAAAARHVQGSR